MSLSSKTVANSPELPFLTFNYIIIQEFCKGAESIKIFNIGINDAGQRLDKFLTKVCKNLPASMMYKYIRTKKIKVNRKRAEISYRLSEGDTVELFIPDEFLDGHSDKHIFLNLKPDLNVVYEDANILLADKKEGMIVHSDIGEEINTLINQINLYLYNKGEYTPENENFFAPALANRIDRNTGGIVICAKNAQSLRILNDKIKNRELTKKYLCMAHGIFAEKSAELTAYHYKDSDTNTVKIRNKYFEGSKTIITRYKVLKEKGNLSLVEVELITGRTHQIRAHLAYIGHPLLGDSKYGTNEQAKTDRRLGFYSQALYSYSLTFNFKSDAEILNYLNGRTFKVNEVDFAKSFFSFG